MVIVCCAGLHIARRGGRKDSKLDVIQVNHIAVAGQDAGRLISDSILWHCTAVSQIHSVLRGERKKSGLASELITLVLEQLW